MKRVQFFDTVMGKIGIAEKDGAVTNIFFEGTVQPGEYRVEKAPVLAAAGKQLLEYFAGKRTAFAFPMQAEGTEFERAVWSALSAIPYGETRSYKQIADSIGRPKACRAVGRANGRNPINIVVPCHRVIGANGALTGYSAGLDFKERLLKLEGIL